MIGILIAIEAAQILLTVFEKLYRFTPFPTMPGLPFGANPR
jgi:hypothetical protein